MKSMTKRGNSRILPLFILTLLTAGFVSAQTLLLSDNFDEELSNEIAETFNTYLSDTQSGTLATKTYTIGSGNSHAAQHSNGGTQMTLASFEDLRGFGQVSLDHNFAADANAADKPLQISFKLVDVFGYDSDTTRWVSFCVGEAQNQFVTNPGAGIIFRKSGDVNTFGGAGGIGTWAAGDLVTITLSGTGGVGSAFDGGGSEATFTVGGNTIGTFDLGQRTNAFLTFSAYNNLPTAVFGGANFDNLSVSLITAAVPDYDTWAGAFTPPIGLPAADDDNDGLTNFQEYAFGLIPNNGASVNPIAVSLDKSTGTFSYTRRDSSLTTLNYSIWYSTDLDGWLEDTGANEGTPVLNGEVETVPVTLTGSLLTNPTLFIQVRAN